MADILNYEIAPEFSLIVNIRLFFSIPERYYDVKNSITKVGASCFVGSTDLRESPQVFAVRPSSPP
jgi:hypothetical protein